MCSRSMRSDFQPLVFLAYDVYFYLSFLYFTSEWKSNATNESLQKQAMEKSSGISLA